VFSHTYDYPWERSRLSIVATIVGGAPRIIWRTGSRLLHIPAASASRQKRDLQGPGRDAKERARLPSPLPLPLSLHHHLLSTIVRKLGDRAPTEIAALALISPHWISHPALQEEERAFIAIRQSFSFHCASSQHYHTLQTTSTRAFALIAIALALLPSSYSLTIAALHPHTPRATERLPPSWVSQPCSAGSARNTPRSSQQCRRSCPRKSATMSFP